MSANVLPGFPERSCAICGCTEAHFLKRAPDDFFLCFDCFDSPIEEGASSIPSAAPHPLDDFIGWLTGEIWAERCISPGVAGYIISHGEDPTLPRQVVKIEEVA